MRVSYICFALLLAACSSSSSSSPVVTGPTPPPPAAKPAPENASQAPTLEEFESGTPQTTPSGNTPFPHGVVCTPNSDDAANIVYSCSVYMSKTQTCKQSGFTCSALGVKEYLNGGAEKDLTPDDPPKADADFGLKIAKADFPTLSNVRLTANATTGPGGVSIARPYVLEPQ